MPHYITTYDLLLQNSNDTVLLKAVPGASTLQMDNVSPTGRWL